MNMYSFPTHYSGCNCGKCLPTWLDILPSGKKKTFVLAGFLGAGKTSTVNHILKQEKMADCDIVVQEFGQITVDDKLLEIGADRIHAFNGASLHIDRQTMLSNYLENLYTNSSSHPFENLVIEASGAESGEQIAQLFYLPKTREHFELSAFITVVDAEFGMLDMEEFSVALEQIILADIIIINKIDRVNDSEYNELRKTIQSLNPCAKIIYTSYGKVDYSDLIYDNYKLLKACSEEFSGGKRSMNQFKTISICVKEPLSKAKVNDWIGNLYEKWGSKILRCKGCFNIEDSNYRFEFQSVRTNTYSNTDKLWSSEEERETILVLIGTQLPEEQELKSGLQSCRA